MQPREIAALLHRIGLNDSRIDRQLADENSAERAITRWTEALTNVPATLPDGSWDVGRAVRNYYERKGGDNSAQYRPMEPHDVLAAWAPHRTALMQRHTDPAPAVDPDNVAAYLAELRTGRTAVATGQATPVEQRALTAAPIDPRIAERLHQIGSPIPEQARAQLAQFRPRAADREALVRAGGPDPLAVACTWCHAEPGKPCRGGWRPNGKGRRIKNRPHDSRIDLAAQQQGVAA
ncbi:hypothetical protein SSP35_05_02300 [Streptomyces sp. NBRC 110611]|uniref:zinc finger domain-containing protein n=1 Tax=Streptomyces sp. NBRC 110611 TaxID=1621259 RepID=UPI0008304319|nr:hypothetical protein [Streptomyces sp. NBRC 110611]GAU67663.1 hypothetical protein SSP35_05_02300 [Streptomyces sp. NBRC 110611]